MIRRRLVPLLLTPPPLPLFCRHSPGRVPFLSPSLVDERLSPCGMPASSGLFPVAFLPSDNESLSVFCLNFLSPGNRQKRHRHGTATLWPLFGTVARAGVPPFFCPSLRAALWSRCVAANAVPTARSSNPLLIKIQKTRFKNQGQTKTGRAGRRPPSAAAVLFSSRFFVSVCRFLLFVWFPCSGVADSRRREGPRT